MKNPLKRFVELKEELDADKAEAERLRGRIEQIERELRKLGAGSLEEAGKEASRLEKEAAAAERELERELAEYDRKWGKQ